MPVHISRVVLRNFKSLQECDVSLGPITFLVGPNGVGKSNFLEALRFLAYALTNSLEVAIADRSGFRSLLNRNAGPDATISFRVSLPLGYRRSAEYSAEIGADEEGPVAVIREECTVQSPEGTDWFRVLRGKVTSNQAVMPAASEHKLYLVNASGILAFGSVYHALSNVVVYNPVPDEIRGFKPEKGFQVLDRKGSALAETLYQLKNANQERLDRVKEYIRAINPGLLNFDAVSVDDNYTLRFRLESGRGVPVDLPSQNMSDGTLRALAVLVALFQSRTLSSQAIIGLEEPEAGLHPAAAGVLFDSLMEASRLEQIIVTSHSPDLLDREDIPEDAIKPVAMRDGRTIIGRIDNTGRAALRERLYTAGELMRMNQLQPETSPDCADVR
jgi:predicted ATPase